MRQGEVKALCVISMSNYSANLKDNGSDNLISTSPIKYQNSIILG
jgi:hypothetical protein